MPVSRRIPLAASAGHVSQKGARERRAARIAKLLAALERAAQEALGTTHLSRREGQYPGHDEHASLGSRRGVLAHNRRVIAVRSRGENRVHECLAMIEVAMGVVVPAERSSEPEHQRILARVQTVVQRGAEIRVMAADPKQPGLLPRQAEGSLELRRKTRVVASVPSPRLLGLGAGRQLLRRILTQALQHRELSGLLVTGQPPDQALVE